MRTVRGSALIIVLTTLIGCGALLDLDRFSPASTGEGGAGGVVVVGGAAATGGGGASTGGGGAGPACTPWSQTFRATANQVVEIVDVEPLDDCGAIVVVRGRSDVVGLLESSLEPTGTPPRSWVVRLNATGGVEWQVLYEAFYGMSVDDVEVDGSTVFVVGDKSGAAFEVHQGGAPTAIGPAGNQAFVIELGLADGSRSDPPEFTGGVAVFHAIKRQNGVSYLAGAFEGDLNYDNFSLGACSARCAVVIRDDGTLPQANILGTAGGAGGVVDFTHLAVVAERIAVAGLLDGDIGLSANRGIVTRTYEASNLSADSPRLVHSTSTVGEQLTGMRFDGDSAVEVLVVWDGALAVDEGNPLETEGARSHTWLRLEPGAVQHRTWSGMTVPATFSVHDLLAPVGDDQLLLAGATAIQIALQDEMPSPLVGTVGAATNAFWARLDTSAPPPTVVQTDTLPNSAQRATFVTHRGGRVFLAGTYDGSGAPTMPQAPPAMNRDAFIVVRP